MVQVQTKVKAAVCLLGICLGFIALSEAAEKGKQQLKDLKNSKPEVRRNAADELGKMQEQEAIDPLIKVLEDSDASVRRAAVDSLGILRAKEAAQPIAELLLKDPDDEVRQVAAIALGSIGEASTGPALVKAISDKHIGTQLEAIATLGKIRYQDATDPLVNMLKDKNQTVREMTVIALSRINNKKAIPPLEPLLEDAVPNVRKQTAYALGSMGAEQSVSKIKKLLKDPQEDVQLSAASALGRLKDASGLDVAARLVKSGEALQRRKAVEIYGLVGKPEDKTFLSNIQKTDTDKSVQNAARQAIDFIDRRYPKKSKTKTEKK